MLWAYLHGLDIQVDRHALLPRGQTVRNEPSISMLCRLALSFTASTLSLVASGTAKKSSTCSPGQRKVDTQNECTMISCVDILLSE